MIAILTYDGDGNNVIIAIVAKKNNVSNYIKEHTQFKDKGYVNENLINHQEYWCKSFDGNEADKKGIILTL